MSRQDFGAQVFDELRARVTRLANAEADIEHRVQLRSAARENHGGKVDDPVRKRLVWLLWRISSQRKAAADELAQLSHSDRTASGDRGTRVVLQAGDVAEARRQNSL
jgi:hypothetical protein